MGNPAYDAWRAAEEAEAKRDLAAAETGLLALDAIKEFFNGRATLAVMPSNLGTIGGPHGGYSIRFYRDQPQAIPNPNSAANPSK